MVDAVNSEEFTDHKPATGRIKHGNRVAERVKRAGRGLTKTHSVASEAVRKLRLESVSLSGFAKRTLNRELPRRKAKERGTRCTLTTAQEVIQYEGQLQNGVMAIERLNISM